MVDKKLHIVMFPWFAMGHITPFLHLSNKLAERGHKITLILPNKVMQQLQPLVLYPSHITLHSINVPHVHPLPPTTETASDIHIHLTTHLATALDLTRPQVESIIMNLHLKPQFIFHDFAYWIPDIASRLGIKSIYYSVVCAASIAIALVPARNLPHDRPICEKDVSHPPPGYPSLEVVLHGVEAKSMIFLGLEFGSGITFYQRTTKGMMSCDAIAIRTCREIEGNFVDYLIAQYNKPVLLSGPILLNFNDNNNNNNNNTSLEPEWNEWLNKFEPGSVVFGAFGSQFIFEKDQFQELLLGFEMTNMPFLVALKQPTGCTTIEEALPIGFKERIGERGIVLGCWVQQPLILAHPSVGCFVNHCGFGSMWEGLMAKCQIVMVPQLGDQFLNTRLVAGQLKAAVEVERSENGWVSKENLCNAIKSVMDEGSDIGCFVRKNHAKWRELISQEYVEGYIDQFVKDMQSMLS